MDLSRFESIIRDPRRTRPEVETMRKHALGKGEIECAAIASEVLSARFPATTRRGGGGAKPTTARFCDETHEFSSGKDAYLWLVARFLAHCPYVLDRYAALHEHASSRSKGCRFARDPLELFPQAQALFKRHQRRPGPALCALAVLFFK